MYLLQGGKEEAEENQEEVSGDYKETIEGNDSAVLEGEEPEISIHVMAVTPTPYTMRLLGNIQGQLVVVLDLGSTQLPRPINSKKGLD